MPPFIKACSGTGPWLRLVAGEQPRVAGVRFMGFSEGWFAARAFLV
jgi:hypothetical protein